MSDSFVERQLDLELKGIKAGSKAGSFVLYIEPPGGAKSVEDEVFVASCVMELRSLRKATSFADGFRGMVVEVARDKMQSTAALLALAQTIRHIEQGSSKYLPIKYREDASAARDLFYTGANKNRSREHLVGGGGQRRSSDVAQRRGQRGRAVEAGVRGAASGCHPGGGPGGHRLPSDAQGPPATGGAADG